MIFNVKDSKLIPAEPFTLQEIIKHNGKEVNLDFVEETRTNLQNRYLWKVFQIISEHYSNKGEQISKEAVKARMLYKLGHADYYIAKEDGKMFGIIKETKNLSKKEFSELTENVRNFMAGEGLYILSPEEYNSKLKTN